MADERDGGYSNRALAAVWRRGYLAGERGDPARCPYKDKRTRRDGVTYSRALRNAWFSGYEAGRVGEPLD